MQVPVNTLATPRKPYCSRQQPCKRMSTSRQPTDIPPYRAHTWCARLLDPSIHVWILRSPQLRHEAVLGRSSSLRGSPARRFEWARICRAPLPPQPTHSSDSVVRLRSAIVHQRLRASAQVSGVVPPKIPVRPFQRWRERGAPFARLPVHRAWS